jgi:hypothetical protein
MERPREAVEPPDDDDVHIAPRDSRSKPLESRALKASTTDALVLEDCD